MYLHRCGITHGHLRSDRTDRPWLKCQYDLGRSLRGSNVKGVAHAILHRLFERSSRRHLLDLEIRKAASTIVTSPMAICFRSNSISIMEGVRKRKNRSNLT